MRDYVQSRDALRIVHVVASFHPGGMERGLVRLIESMHLNSHAAIEQSLVVLGRGNQELLDRCSNCAEIHELQAPRQPWTAAIRLRRIIREFEPQIVHARATSSWCDAAWATRRNANTRLVLGFHGRENNAAVAWRKRIRLARAIRQADAVVSVSYHAATWLRKTWPQLSDVTVIHNGVDTKALSPLAPNDRAAARQQFLAPRERFLIACVANLLPIKRLDVLLEAHRRTLTIIPDARLIVAGIGPQREQLESMIQLLRLQNHVSLLGDRNDIRTLLATADLFVLTSDYECCSNALLEAMAMALPCVATQVGGNPELITPHRTGWLVPAANSGALADTMIHALLNPDARARLGQTAREYVIDHHQPGDMVQSYLNLYRNLSAGITPAKSSTEELYSCAG